MPFLLKRFLTCCKLDYIGQGASGQSRSYPIQWLRHKSVATLYEPAEALSRLHGILKTSKKQGKTTET